MSLQAYQTPSPCTAVYNTVRQDFTTLEIYHECTYTTLQIVRWRHVAAIVEQGSTLLHFFWQAEHQRRLSLYSQAPEALEENQVVESVSSFEWLFKTHFYLKVTPIFNFHSWGHDSFQNWFSNQNRLNNTKEMWKYYHLSQGLGPMKALQKTWRPTGAGMS